MRISAAVMSASRLRSSAVIALAVRPFGKRSSNGSNIAHSWPEFVAGAERDAVHAGVDGGRRHAGRAEHDRNDLLDDGVRAREARARRHRDAERDVALVLRGDEAARRVEHAPAREHEQAGVQHAQQRAAAQQRAGEPRVPAAQALEPRVGALAELVQPRADGRACARRVVRLQDHGRERGRQSQRDEQRDHGRGRDRQRELLVELPRDPAHERRRHEHGDEHERDADQCAADLVHREVRRLARRHAGAQVTFRVLDDDDRVVDDDADREHEAEHRQVVQREAERRHDRRACRSARSGSRAAG